MLETARRLYGRALSGAVGLLARIGIHPNVLTWISVLPAAAAGLVAASGGFLLAAILLLVSGLFDLLDGALARSSGQESRFGALLDSTLDRLSDAAVPAGLVVFYAPLGTVVLLPVALIAGAFLVSYVRARAEGLGMNLPRLWMRREDRLLVLTGGLVLAHVPVPGVDAPAPLLLIVVGLLGALSFLAAGAALAAGRHR